ncbi:MULTISPECIES: Rne/Rng family ribonuclease [Fusobacterium]|uniref:Rne/Rng family ribonuclease n=1 Tax=Fusobacterium TaxID=848 RepID=UPI001476953A|nr:MULTISPECIES: Rne/Rng family ribonuclease [Fusobacterium]NME36790.1 Rne/Rng family ribonuclease [Fusobacterium sp. FSA-380-WT-3A]
MNKIIISVNDFQKKAAIIEEDKVVEIFNERNDESNIIKNIYKGKVANVLPGMESAFVDIGLEKNSFLFIDDLREFEEKYLNGLVNSNKTIEELLTVGDKVVVQVLNVPRGNKGARVTTNFTIPGKYLVLMPNNDHLAISKKIKDETERKRLEDIFLRIKPSKMGVIIRTAAEGKTVERFEKELNYLVKKWEEIEKKILKAKDGEILYNDNDIVTTILRDILNDTIDEVIVDNEKVYLEIIDYLDTFDENKIKAKIKLYSKDRDIFDEYNINSEIKNALEKEVWLECGGYLVIEKTEALVSIDVNTGKNTGSYNLERTVLNTNLEAAREIPRQLRLRNLSGIIIIDFIDMKLEEDKELVLQQLGAELGRDRIKNNIVHFTDLGLVEMTRKRVGRNLSYFYEEECPLCKGKGKIKSSEIIVKEILKEIKELSSDTDIKKIYIKTKKEVLKLIRDIYMDFINEYMKSKNKKIIFEEEEIFEYEISLEK